MDFDDINEKLSEMSAEEFSEWEGSDEGIEAMRQKIIWHGECLLSDDAPPDWAWQVVGFLGCGYSAVTKQGVQDALMYLDWLQITTVGALVPWGGPTMDRYAAYADNDNGEEHED